MSIRSSLILVGIAVMFIYYVNPPFVANHDNYWKLTVPPCTIHKYSSNDTRNISERNLPKEFKEAASKMGEEYYNYSNVTWEWGNLDLYDAVEYLGGGGFGDAYLSKVKETNESLVVKILKKNGTNAIKRELKIYEVLKDGPHILQFGQMARDPANHSLFGYTLPYLKMGVGYRMFRNMTDWDIRYVFYQMLKGIEYAHSKGVIHRDIKPANIAIDPDNLNVTIIDWGLGEFYLPFKKFAPRAGTMPFMAPEQLFYYKYLDYSMDIWSFGATFASMVTDRYPFYPNPDKTGLFQLRKINRHLGTECFIEYGEEFNLSFPWKHKLNYHLGTEWGRYATENNTHKLHGESVDLLNKLLVYNQHDRLTAHEALQHRYFDPIREFYELHMKHPEKSLKELREMMEKSDLPEAKIALENFKKYGGSYVDIKYDTKNPNQPEQQGIPNREDQFLDNQPKKEEEEKQGDQQQEQQQQQQEQQDQQNEQQQQANGDGEPNQVIELTEDKAQKAETVKTDQIGKKSDQAAEKAEQKKQEDGNEISSTDESEKKGKKKGKKGKKTKKNKKKKTNKKKHWKNKN